MVWVLSLSTMELISHSLTPVLELDGIRSLKRVGNPVGPLTLSVLYLRQSSYEAIPKYISEKTSYHRVWLAFHSYPQLIRTVFNLYRFGPPVDVTRPSLWSWIDHPASGLPHTTIALLRLAFATAPPRGLTLLHTVSRWLIMQKARRHTV